MDLTYYEQNFVLEIYVGRLHEKVELVEEVNQLVWLEQTEDFADTARFAGEKNIAHIVNMALKYSMEKVTFTFRCFFYGEVCYHKKNGRRRKGGWL